MNECLNCGFYDEDYGCTCSSLDKWYACPIEKLPDSELEKIFDDEKNNIEIKFPNEVPTSEQERIKKNFSDTIDSYLDTMGIKKEGE